MRFDVLTIFPGLFDVVFSETIIRKAVDRGTITINIHDIRDYTTDRHRVTDDLPYGGGPGMVMKPEPIFSAVEDVTGQFGKGTVVLLTPKGRLLSSALARELAGNNHLILICGRYEGVDNRVAERLADIELSIGDYVLTGGEIPAMVLIDSVSRFVPGVVGTMESVTSDSFEEGMLGEPHYTRPPRFRDMNVPEVLLSGNHEKIRDFRIREALRKTLDLRPDLLKREGLTDDAKRILDELMKEEESEKTSDD
jgi:tRNA (guanine37-N1)-methyltransferase